MTSDTCQRKHNLVQKTALCSICNDANDCRPLTQIATELSLTRKYLIYWFQTDCDLISLRYKHHVSRIAILRREQGISHVLNITWQLQCQGIYPSNRKVAESIRLFRLSLLKQHIRMSHRSNLKKLGS